MIIGSIGNGSIINLLSNHFNIKYKFDIDKNKSNCIKSKLSKCNVILLAIPLNKNFEKSIRSYASILKNDCIIVNLSTMMSESSKIISKYFNNEIVNFHPIFGPLSYNENIHINFAINGKLSNEIVKIMMQYDTSRLKTIIFHEIESIDHDENIGKAILHCHLIPNIFKYNKDIEQYPTNNNFEYVKNIINGNENNMEFLKNILLFSPNSIKNELKLNLNKLLNLII